VTDRPTDGPTDHATRSVRIGRIYVHSSAMRPNNTFALQESNVSIAISEVPQNTTVQLVIWLLM